MVDETDRQHPDETPAESAANGDEPADGATADGTGDGVAPEGESGDDDIADSREAELDERERALDQREKGIEKQAEELDERETALHERERQLDEGEAALDERQEELSELRGQLQDREVSLNQREQTLDERERAIETREQELDERAARLDEHEETLNNYLQGQVEHLQDNVEAVMWSTLERYEENRQPGRLGPTGAILAGLAGATLVAAGVGYGAWIAFDGGAGALGSESADLTAGAALALVGVAVTLAALADRA